MGAVGRRLVLDLRGIPCLRLEECPPPKHGITVSRSFGRPVTTLAEMREAVATYTARAAEKLRGERLAVNVLTVFLTTNTFKDEPQYSNATTIKLPVATNSTGVMLTALVPAGQIQVDLFDHQDRERSSRLMRVPDRLNDHMGAGTLRYAAEGIAKHWGARFERCSPAYTTNWRDLPVARAS